MTPKLVIFDCDGTLVDSQAMIVAAMQRAYDVLGAPRPSANDVRHIVGLSLPQAIAALSPDLEPDAHRDIADAYKKAFFELRLSGEVEDQLYPGVLDLLTTLEARGYVMGVATGKSRRGLAAIVEKYALAPFFVTLQTADDHPSKPHPSMVHQALAEAGSKADLAVMIGDTSYDMVMARDAKVAGLGVAWGYHAPDHLVAHGAHAVAHEAGDLMDLIEGLLARESDHDR